VRAPFFFVKTGTHPCTDSREICGRSGNPMPTHTVVWDSEAWLRKGIQNTNDFARPINSKRNPARLCPGIIPQKPCTTNEHPKVDLFVHLTKRHQRLKHSKEHRCTPQTVTQTQSQKTEPAPATPPHHTLPLDG
jgi:hypothetical protein